jgi:hypothetical protein
MYTNYPAVVNHYFTPESALPGRGSRRLKRARPVWYISKK